VLDLTATSGRDATVLRASRDRLAREACSTQALVIFTHARCPARGRIVRAGHGHRRQR
jgi:hypothetical protein